MPHSTFVNYLVIRFWMLVRYFYGTLSVTFMEDSSEDT